MYIADDLEDLDTLEEIGTEHPSPLEIFLGNLRKTYDSAPLLECLIELDFALFVVALGDELTLGKDDGLVVIVGELDGCAEGVHDGNDDGSGDGCSLGSRDGVADGLLLGLTDTLGKTDGW